VGSYPIDFTQCQGDGDRIKLSRRIQRGEVVFVDLIGALGMEQTKVRRCVVVSNNTINQHARTIIIVPITTHDGKGTVDPHEVGITTPNGESGLVEPSAAQPLAVRSIDPVRRVRSVVGKLNDEDLEAIFDTLTWCTDVEPEPEQ